MIIMIYLNLSAAITENNLWFIECWQIYPTNIARNKWEYDLKILFYKKKKYNALMLSLILHRIFWLSPGTDLSSDQSDHRAPGLRIGGPTAE